jgi:hypothetical protein
VISNQALLVLIEKPVPINLIALYTSFPGPVPPLIRKRGTELLQIMQDAASQVPTIGTATAFLQVEDQQMSVVLDAPQHPVFSIQATPVPELWNITSLPGQVTSTKMVTSRSSLFGNIAAVVRHIPSQRESTSVPTIAKMSTRYSAFLGSGLPSTSESITAPAGETVQHKIAKIHEGILNGDKKVIPP